MALLSSSSNVAIFVAIAVSLFHASTSTAIQTTPSGIRKIGGIAVPECEAHFCSDPSVKNEDESSVNKQCGCDLECVKRRDCCMNAVDDSKIGAILEKDLYFCMSTPRGHGPYLVVGRCPANWTNDVVRKACETGGETDPNRLLPVTSTRTNQTYKNIYCGQCNEGEIKPGQFHLQFKCKEGNVSSVQAALQDSTCDAFVDEGGIVCRSMDKTVSVCSEKWVHENKTFSNEVRLRCEMQFGPITFKEKRYRNIYCAVCNGDVGANDNKLIKDNVTCRNSFYPIEKEFILDIDGEFEAGSLIPGSGGKVCESGEVYDPFRQKCRQVTCSGSNCQNITAGAWNSIHLNTSASPCNMTLVQHDGYILHSNGSINLVNDSEVIYEPGEFESVAVAGQNDSVLLCRRANSKSIALFPQHFCERRKILGYGSCGCQEDCVQSRSCCLDAFDDVTVDSFRAHAPWICLNDTQRTSAVSLCPLDFPSDSEIRTNCESTNLPPLKEDPLVHIPAFAWDHGAFYRNVFCAACNGATNVTFHRLRFQCAEHASMRNGYEAAKTFADKPNLCQLEMELASPQLPVKPCVMDPECQTCPADWGLTGDPFQVGIRWRCEHYYAPISVNGVCYRNDFCAVCNGIEPNNDGKNKRAFSDHLLNPPTRYSDFNNRGIFTTFTVG